MDVPGCQGADADGHHGGVLVLLRMCCSCPSKKVGLQRWLLVLACAV